ncbi:MAG TPA: hypothetical protein PK096_04120 [Candidatus Saccharibacteria bacterium]|nr:hypothetical protein [Candidatus Saccharibacteria bacterium]HRK94528.1 hypothetical protein [Candidatus Saccharibacteria bacterium]
MTAFDADNTQFGGLSYEELRQHTEVLLKAGELAEALQSQPANSTDRNYSVSDPRVMEMVELPAAVRDINPLGRPPDSIEYRSTVHTTGDRTYVSSSVAICLPFATVHIAQHDGKHLLQFENDVTPTGVVDPEETSAILARIAQPTYDPSLSDFKDLNDVGRASELCETLGNNDMVTSTVEHTYAVDDCHQVIVESKDGKLLSCEVVEFRDDQEIPLALTVEFNNWATASNLYQMTSDGSKELIMDESDVERFIDIIDALLTHVRPVTSSQEDLD